MKRHNLLSAARLVLEFVLALPGCEAAIAMDIDVPPDVICQMRMRPHAVAAPVTVAPAGNEQPHSRAAQSAVIRYPVLDCRMREPTIGPDTVRRAVEDDARAGVAAR